ncbi:MAG: OmpH family outer membrane protein [Planctomycetota bacterium]|nr:OmpH family outer membrane protein [Planctomycetota bacterium]
MQRKPDRVEWILGAIIVAAIIFVWVSSNSGDSQVATIQTDRIANEIGYAVQAETMFREERSKLESELAQQRKILSGDIEEKQRDYEESPSPEKEENLRAMQQQMQSQLIRLTKVNQEKMQRLRRQMKQDFYTELKPVILQLVAERDFALILDSSQLQEGIVYLGPTTDITDLVIQKFRDPSMDGPIESPPTSIPGTP